MLDVYRPALTDSIVGGLYLGLRISESSHRCCLLASAPLMRKRCSAKYLQGLGFAYCMYTWASLQDMLVMCTLDQLL